jgi:hypothetical protein
MSAEVGVDGFIPSIDMKVQYSPDKVVTMRGEYEKPASLILETCHSESGEDCVKDGELSLQLLKDEILQARAYIRPAMFEDMKNFFTLDIDMESLEAAYAEIYDDFIREKDARIELINTHLIDPIRNIYQDINYFFVSTWSKMYKNNDLYFKDIMDFLIINYNRLQDKIDELTVIYTDHFTRKWQEIQSIIADLQVKYANSTSSVFEFIEQTQKELKANYKYNLNRLQKINFKLQKSLNSLKEQLLTWIEEIKNDPAYQTVETWVNEQQENIQLKYKEIQKTAKESWEVFRNSEDLKEVYNIILDLFEQLTVVYEMFDVEEQAMTFINDLRENGITRLYTKSLEWLEKQKERWSFEVVAYTFENGLAEIKIGVPKELTSLESLSELKIFQLLEDFYVEMMEQLEPYAKDFLEIYYSAVEYINEAYLVVVSRLPEVLTALRESAQSFYDRVVVPYIQPFVYNLWDMIESLLSTIYDAIKLYATK